LDKVTILAEKHNRVHVEMQDKFEKYNKRLQDLSNKSYLTKDSESRPNSELKNLDISQSAEKSRIAHDYIPEKRIFNVKPPKIFDKLEKLDIPEKFPKKEMDITELNIKTHQKLENVKTETRKPTPTTLTPKKGTSKTTKHSGVLSPRQPKFQKPTTDTSTNSNSGKKGKKSSNLNGSFGSKKEDPNLYNVNVSSHHQERQTQKRLRDLYRELKALEYDEE